MEFNSTSNKHQPLFIFILLVCIGYIGFQQHRIESMTQTQLQMIQQNFEKQIQSEIILPKNIQKRLKNNFDKQIIIIFEPSIAELGILISISILQYNAVEYNRYRNMI